MTISARVIADSYNRGCNARLTTFVLTYPMMVHNEFMTHRKLSRNAASSRAIPIGKQVAAVLDDPAMPMVWGSNRSGMQAGAELEGAELEDAKRYWLEARDKAVESVRALDACHLHKQHAVRILAPWQHITVVCSATDFANFYKLRRDAMAQPEIHALADAMYEAQRSSVPISRTNRGGIEQWHLPFVDDDERATLDALGRQQSNALESVAAMHSAIKVSVGRCARVSYLTHEGKRDFSADIELHDRLMGNGHWSPFEHVACPGNAAYYGNFWGWDQYRKQLAEEHPYYHGQTFPEGQIEVEE